MLYLDEVTLHNFKSFKNTTVKFNKGFTCIVGPNGSGKSNVCDSLLFALGENSLKRMRVHSSAKLINNNAKANSDDKYKRAFVKVKFSGDQEIEITRAVRSDKKVAYRLNGKRVTRQEILELLKSLKSEINETNTITQDEIKYLLSLSPKGKRELIDIAAGIKEFNDKKDAALRELEKVEQKLNESRVILGERSGFLDELEKEKEDAEKYIALSNTIKSSNYTLLKLREQEVAARLDESVRAMKQKTEAKQKIERAIADIDAELAAITAEKDKISKSIAAKSGDAANTNKQLEDVNRNIAVLNTQITDLAERIKSLKSHMETLEAEQKKIKTTERDNREQLKMLNFQIDVKVKNLPEGGGEAQDTSEAEALNERYNNNYKKLEESEAKLVAASNEEAKLSTELLNTEKQVLEMHTEMNEKGARRTTLTNNIKSSKEALTNLDRNKKEVEKELTKATDAIASLRKKLDDIYVEHVNLRELRAQFGSETDRALNALKKGMEKGFHGRVQDLCTYDDKYALAVQAAAGARMNYFIVDSIAQADEGIRILKEQKLGRASFIPIKEVIAKDTKDGNGLTPLLDGITFDKKFKKAFEYVFSNTYVVASIKDAEKKGIGSCRYVTLEGDIVEPSGIVSGGAAKNQMSLAAVENKLKRLEAEKKDAQQKLDETNVAHEMIRKKIAHYESEYTNYDIELKHTLEDEDEVHRAMDSLEERVRAADSRKKELKDRVDKLKKEREAAETAIKALKTENATLRAALDGIIASKAKGGKSKEELARIKALREEIETLKMSTASMAKENDMLAARSEEIEKEIKHESGEHAASKKKIDQFEKEIVNLSKQKEELQTAIDSHGKKTGDLFKQIQELEKKMTDSGAAKGRQNNERERAERDMMEIESKKSQFQTRLNDLKAELLSYPKGEMIPDAKAEELEKQLIVAKADLERLGSVNLKAPEVYEIKKKDVEDAQQKLSTLETEKESIVTMIEEIEKKKLTVFSDTLNTVNENFKKLYGYIFDGSASLYLQNPKDPFNSGLMIEVEIGRKKQDPDLLSGGQKSMTMLMLIFAIQMRKPMSFYIFDEIDAALDKENSKKLSKLIKELSDKSQFVVVSHNDSLIAAADTAIGVVQRDNESQVVGIQLASK